MTTLRAPLPAHFIGVLDGGVWLLSCKRCSQGFSVPIKDAYSRDDLKFLIAHIESHEPRNASAQVHTADSFWFDEVKE